MSGGKKVPHLTQSLERGLQGLGANVQLSHPGIILRKFSKLKLQHFPGIYRGTKRLSKDEVIDIYNGTHVAIDNMSSFYGKVRRPPENYVGVCVTDSLSSVLRPFMSFRKNCSAGVIVGQGLSCYFGLL